MKTYDDVSNYVEETIELSFDAFSPEEARNYAVCHIGCFMTWLIKNDFTNFSKDLVSKVLNKEEFGSDFILNNCDGKLNSIDIKEDVIAFVDSFYPNYFKTYSKVLASELKNLPLEYIVTYADYEKIDFIFNDAYNEFNGGDASSDEIDKAIALLEEQNYEKALELFTKLAERKNEVAASKLGFMYLKGLGVKKDPKKAVEYYNQSVGFSRETGTTQINGTNTTLIAQYAALLFNKEISAGPSGPAFYDLEEKAALLGDTDTLIKRALYLYNQEVGAIRGGKSIEWFQLGARRNSAYCEYMVGKCYYNHIGIKQNYTRALKWFNKAVENNNTDAICFLGKCYQNGTGVDVDSNKAKEYFEKALSLGDKESGYYLALAYRKENQDENKIFELIKDAALNNVVLAQSEYANYLYNGNLVEKDEAQAIQYYTKAAELKDPNACYMLGLLLEEGTAIKQNLPQAVKHYSTAANSNHLLALLKLASCYENGIGLNRNSATAEQLYKKAIDLGSEEAKIKLPFMIIKSQYSKPQDVEKSLKSIEDQIETNQIVQFELGVCYLEGLGVREDLDEAIRLLTLAAKAGIEEAKVKVKEAKLKKLA